LSCSFEKDFLPGTIKKGKKSQAKTPPSAKKKSVKEVKPETAIRFETGKMKLHL